MKFLLIVLFFLLSLPAFAKKTIYLHTKNTVPIYGAFLPNDSTFLLAFKQAVLARGDKTYPIYIVVNSEGGSVFEGLDLVKEVMQHKNIHTITIRAYSMGAILVELLLDSKRYYHPTAEFLFHPMRHYIQGSDSAQLLKYAQDMYKMESFVSRAVIARLNTGPENYFYNINNDKVIKGKDIVKHNIADEAVEIKCSQDAINQRVPYVRRMGILLTSLCPLTLIKE